MPVILQDEVTFVASLASLMPTMPGQLPSEQAAPNLDMLSELMQVCSHSYPALKQLCCMTRPNSKSLEDS